MDFMQLSEDIAKRRGITMAQAMAAVSVECPDIHQAYIERGHNRRVSNAPTGKANLQSKAGEQFGPMLPYSAPAKAQVPQVQAPSMSRRDSPGDFIDAIAQCMSEKGMNYTAAAECVASERPSLREEYIRKCADEGYRPPTKASTRSTFELFFRDRRPRAV